MTIKVHKPYIKTENNEFRQIKPLENLWKNFSTFCLQAENSPNGNTYQHFFLQYDKVYKSEELVKSEELEVRSEELRYRLRRFLNKSAKQIQSLQSSRSKLHSICAFCEIWWNILEKMMAKLILPSKYGTTIQITIARKNGTVPNSKPSIPTIPCSRHLW